MVTTVTQMVKLGSNEAWELLLMFRRNEAWLRKRIRTKPLITLLRSMNSHHREELGDFLCFYPAAYFDGCDALDELLSIVIEQNNQLERFLRGVDCWVDNPTINLRNAFHVDDKLGHRWKAGATLEGFLRCSEKNDACTPFTCIGSFLHSLSYRMVKLDLSRNYLGDRGTVEVCEALKKGLPSLEDLCMSYNNIGEEGANAIYNTLLSHPSCRIERLDLSWNWGMGRSSDELARVLRYENRSLVELDLSGASVEPSFALAGAIYGFSNGCRLLDIPEGYNHHLQVLKCSKQPVEAKTALRSALKMNKEDWYEDTIARKIDHYLSKGYDEIFSGGGHHVSRCLEVVGKHGSDTALYELVKRYLFGTR